LGHKHVENKKLSNQQIGPMYKVQVTVLSRRGRAMLRVCQTLSKQAFIEVVAKTAK